MSNLNEMNDLNDLLYKLNKYQTLLNTDTNVNNKDLYQKKILSYTNKINNIQQVGGVIPEEIQRELNKLNNLMPPKLDAHYNKLDAEHKAILELLKNIKLEHAKPKPAQTDTKAHDAQIVSLQAENAKLKEEIARLSAEIARLKEENKKLKGDKDTPIVNTTLKLSMLNRRLTKERDEAKAAVAAKDAQHTAALAAAEARYNEALVAKDAEHKAALQKALAAKDEINKELIKLSNDLIALFTKLEKNIYYQNIKDNDELFKIIHDAVSGIAYNEEINLIQKVKDNLGLTGITLDPNARENNAKTVFRYLKHKINKPNFSLQKSPQKVSTSNPELITRNTKTTIESFMIRLNDIKEMLKLTSAQPA
jgi:hypothetical protein